MYIEKIHIKNFRAIGYRGVTLNCNKGINIIIGENNAGKSAIIDAVRLGLAAGAYRKNIFVKTSDFHINKYGEQAQIINIDIFFNEVSEEQAVAFFLLTNGANLKQAELHIEYTLYIDKKGNQKVQESIKGGPALNNVPREMYDNINLLYLAALRDAESDLKPSKNGQLANILYSLAKSQEEREKVIQTFKKANEDIMSNELIQSVETIINQNLLNIEKDELGEKVQISLLDHTFESIAALIRLDYASPRLLKISITDMLVLLKELNIEKDNIKGKSIARKISDGKDLEVDMEKLVQYPELEKLYEKLLVLTKNQSINIEQNGLGYNNILHMATSLGNLQERPIEEDISILLVEEPEAHLHPQLLDLLFNFFKKADQDSNIQLFVTSHSPTLVSKADVDSLHILNSKAGENDIVSIKNTLLNEDEKLDLKRYLDVTKSQMFFARRVIFVEGISEAILFNEFSKLFDKPFDKYSIEIVNINGVAFQPFAKLFSNNDSKSYIGIPCAIVSDNDKCTNNDDEFRITKSEKVYSNIDTKKLLEKLNKGSISYRAQNLMQFNKDNICVKLAEKTLEYEIALIDSNIPLLLEILKQEHPAIASDIEAKISDKENNQETDEMIALRIWIAIQDCKGSFSQKLANEINKISTGKRKDATFEVPQYIKDAIDFVVR